jgi:hypothetical protein
MTGMSNIEAIIAIQAGLMDAIDARDIGQIETKTRDLSRALGQIRNRGAMVAGEKQKTDVGYALKQTEALRTRVNFMALRNREMMERLDQMRGTSTPHIYGNRRNMGVSGLQT